jgi:hypothetical protein
MTPTMGGLEALIVGGAVLLVCGTPLLGLTLSVLFGLKKRRRF